MKRILLICLFFAGSLFWNGVMKEVFAQEGGSLPPGVQEAQDRVKKWTSATKAQQVKNEAQIKKQKADLAKSQGLDVKKEEPVKVEEKDKSAEEEKEVAEDGTSDQEESKDQKKDQKTEQKKEQKSTTSAADVKK